MSFKRLSMALSATLLLGLYARNASAQSAIVAEAVSDDTYDASSLHVLQGRGYLLSSGLIFHSAFGLEGGYNDNVFYESSNEAPVSSGLLQLGGRLYLGTQNIEQDEGSEFEASPRSYEFQAGMRFGYREFISDDDAVRKQRRLNVNANLNFIANPGGAVSLIVKNRFLRDMRSPNFEDNQTINRDDNRMLAAVRFRPAGERSSGTLRYENWLSVFEEGGSFPSRMNHTLGALAEIVVGESRNSRLSGDVSIGFFGPLGDGASMVYGNRFKSRSQPFRAALGVASELTENVAAKAHAGYSRSDYDMGPDYSSPNFGAELGLKWPTGGVQALYDFDHFDSSTANFYRDHLFALKLVQQIEYLVLDGGPELRLRKFEGIPTSVGPSERDDVVTALRARAQLILAERFSFSAEYRFSRVKTDYRQADGQSPMFLRNEFMLGVWAAL